MSDDLDDKMKNSLTDYEIICPDEGYIARLKNLWKNVFGDSDECIDGFFNRYFHPEMAQALIYGGTLAAMAYIIPCGEYVHGTHREKCAAIYAVAALPELRGRGFGSAVTDAARAQAQKLGFSSVTLVPAERGLFAFYEKLGFKTAFTIDVSELDVPGSIDNSITIKPANPRQYRRMREELMSATAHIDMDENALELQKFLCGLSGGEMALVQRNGENVGCICWEMENDVSLIKEYIGTPDISSVIGGIKAGRYVVWRPGAGRPFAMAYGPGADMPTGYYGFAFG